MVRTSAVAGHFYPKDPGELSALIEKCLEGIAPDPRRCEAAVVPHAGLIYSGQCAGAVFGRLVLPRTVVVLCPNHTGTCRSPGASLWRSGVFDTPLGPVSIDESFAVALEQACDLVVHDPAAHRFEHAIEVELPFLIARSPGTAIVPIVIAWSDWLRSERLAAALAETVAARRSVAPGSDVLLLASSDMSHYEGAAEADRKDRMALAAIERVDGRALLEVCERERISMCGRAPVAVVLEAARRLGASDAEVVDYRHSGWVSGRDDDVVSYAGVLIGRRG
ncbi:MAG TPA: AmmeMemoRadiSam system protein B [Vicinamibacterales bacterium]